VNGGALKLDRDKLIRAREMLGYGLEKTAEEAGVSKNSVLRAEHEEDIRPVTARKIAAALDVRVADLIGESENLKAEAPPSPEQPRLNGFEEERRAPSLQSWTALVNRLADRWEREIESRDAELQEIEPGLRKQIRIVRNLNWANEISATAGAIVGAVTDELEAGLDMITAEEVVPLVKTLKRMDAVVDSAKPWFASVGKDEPEGARVHDISEAAERRAEHKAAVERIGRQFGA
jgi:transcriptional regulator with XRE-family HTH domain